MRGIENNVGRGARVATDDTFASKCAEMGTYVSRYMHVFVLGRSLSAGINRVKRKKRGRGKWNKAAP